jgi:hypothetical protein
MYARITDAGTRHLYEYRTNEILKITNASIVKTNKAIRKNTKNQTNILIWTAIIAALSFGVSVTNLILNWPKKDQKPSQQLIINKPNIQSSQTRNPQSQPKSDTFYQKEAKKTLPKKK